jgi:hypothetical protein
MKRIIPLVHSGVADWRYEFVRGGGAATHKFIPGLSNAYILYSKRTAHAGKGL